MTAVIVTTPDQLQAIIAESVREAVAAATAKQRVNATDLTAELGVSVPTLARMEKDGRLPPREGRYWNRKALDKWQRDRA